MVFVLKRTPAFQLFGPFQDRSQAEAWIKRHANKRRYACCILEPVDPPPGEGKRRSSQRRIVKRRLTVPPIKLKMRSRHSWWCCPTVSLVRQDRGPGSKSPRCWGALIASF